MDDIINAIIVEMKELKITIVNGHTKQQAMEYKIFALESDNVNKERVWEIKIELQVQAYQIQSEPTSIDSIDINRKCLQEIKDQPNLLFWMEKYCKVEAYKES